MTREQFIAEYAAGRRDFTKLDIGDRIDLSDVNLSGADFSECWLEASFDNADLSNARLTKANLKCSSFVNAKLTGADFRGSALCAADFTGAVFDGAMFEDAYMYGYTFAKDEQPVA
ncbi:Serine/threonine-protein kinase B [Rubripirellula tenax]|uniref:Serine/threonine-protein kinase B n=1 Tax=Rubripirellula tenax TaxID=2528015 RepID=A0A5C6FHF0_9BACT|nr:pentapeptide repeat-containing protein [Rubripirellula tenax]TWU60310.1 Serine/threonine-protein kinase B [Rubripirellula tenax]